MNGFWIIPLAAWFAFWIGYAIKDDIDMIGAWALVATIPVALALVVRFAP